jgi:hypothetical protein
MHHQREMVHDVSGWENTKSDVCAAAETSVWNLIQCLNKGEILFLRRALSIEFHAGSLCRTLCEEYISLSQISQEAIHVTRKKEHKEN